MSIAAIIVAAGRGLRAGGELPKQWQNLRGKPVIWHTFNVLRPHVDDIVVVLHPDDQARWAALGLDAAHVVTGGATRDASVREGLAALAANPPDNVLIHDAARPLVSAAIITDVIAALDHHAGAAPAIAVTDALWTGVEGFVSGSRDRSGLFRAQTPQGFHYAAIVSAHDQRTGPAVDDVEVARGAGLDVAIVAGEEHNLKITTHDDFSRAANMLGHDMDVRCGNGYDVHRFGDGDHVWLCGVKVPHGRGLQGHSDADVGMHAVTDAIYGALGMGDIGQHFPPSDPQWRGAPSRVFLEHAASLVADRNGSIGNIDLTIICEAPKVGPHRDAMRKSLSDILKIDPTRISVKATTTEKLGFTGRGEGIAAQAAVTVRLP